MKPPAADNLTLEKQLWQEGYSRIMGLDEVGRGCLAGPVVAAGVILNPHSIPSGLDDSKKLSAEHRTALAKEIYQHAVFVAVQEGSLEEIRQLNILWASVAAMQRCTEETGAHPDYLLIDGNRYTATLLPHSCIVRGDAKSASIAAASIVAKVYRDNLMKGLHQRYPYYGWDKNVGYPTKAHRNGIRTYGVTPYHRTTFRLLAD